MRKILDVYKLEKELKKNGLRVNRCCGTCEFNFDGICASSNYGEVIKNKMIKKDCWEMGFDYFIELNMRLEKKLDNDDKIKMRMRMVREFPGIAI